MGACASETSGSAIEKQLTSVINKELNKDRGVYDKHKKILFLGSGGAGKSTVFKQLRQIHGEGFSDEDKKEFIPLIHSQLINEMKSALNIYIDYNLRQKQREKKEQENNDYDNYDIDDDLLLFDNLILQSSELSNTEAADQLLTYKYNKKQCFIDNDIMECIKSLWNESIIREIYDKRNITRLETSSAHFWNKLDDIQNANYLPTEHDILLCRFVTTGLHEMTFRINNDTLDIIDVGGQRSQRRKWIHCFEYVVAVIFIASLSCYDEILYEDTDVNAMVDQIELFDDICNNSSLSKVSMILFLNKKDLFKEKYVSKRIPLSRCPAFDKYCDGKEDPYDFTKGTKFIQNEFTELNKTPNQREIFNHLTCATDANNIQKVFADVQLVVISNALAEGGYMDFDD